MPDQFPVFDVVFEEARPNDLAVVGMHDRGARHHAGLGSQPTCREVQC